MILIVLLLLVIIYSVGAMHILVASFQILFLIFMALLIVGAIGSIFDDFRE